jgi:NAD(P)-dependent dehydrogenase (short-subunit alcohol dehydrogenase family)
MNQPQPPQTILITGCSSGFGEVAAKTLALAGHRVFATMRDVSGRNTEAGATIFERCSSDPIRPSPGYEPSLDTVRRRL